jgi:hypothetical protein
MREVALAVAERQMRQESCRFRAADAVRPDQESASRYRQDTVNEWPQQPKLRAAPERTNIGTHGASNGS